jgi:hypothetical protein
MPPTTICEFIYYMNSIKVDYHVRNIYMNSMNTCEFIYYMNSTKVDYHVRNIYINSINLQIHVLIEFTCF